MPDKIPLSHPGQFLLDELEERGITQYRLAQDIGVPRRRINEIVLGKRGITADTSVRLGRYFNTSPDFWLRLQAFYDVEKTKEALGDRLEREVKVSETNQPAIHS